MRLHRLFFVFICVLFINPGVCGHQELPGYRLNRIRKSFEHESDFSDKKIRFEMGISPNEYLYPPEFVSDKTRQVTRVSRAGDIETVLQKEAILRISRNDQPVIDWVDFEIQSTIKFSHAPSEMLQEIDARDLALIKEYVALWPQDLRERLDSAFGVITDCDTSLNDKNESLNLYIAGHTFMPMALYWMAKLEIPVSQVVSTIATEYGHFTNFWNPGYALHQSRMFEISVLARLDGVNALSFNSKKIISVGCFSNPIDFSSQDWAAYLKNFNIIKTNTEYFLAERAVSQKKLRLQKEEKEKKEAEEKNLREIDDRAFAICKSKLSTFSRDVVLKLTEQLFRDELNPFSCNWLQNNNQDLSGNCTFGGWNFMPQALLGLVTYNFAPRLAVLALEGALCNQVAVLTSACALAPEVICVAAGAAGIVLMADAACKTVRAIIKAVEVAQNMVRAYNAAQKSECVMPRTSTQVLESEAEPETLLGTEETASTDPARSATGGPEPPDDEETKLRKYLDEAFNRNDAHKKSHILQEKHKWEKLVIDPKNNWYKIERYMKEAILKGSKEVENALRNTFISTHTINGYTVQVVYKEINGIIKYIGDAWIV